MTIDDWQARIMEKFEVLILVALFSPAVILTFIRPRPIYLTLSILWMVVFAVLTVAVIAELKEADQSVTAWQEAGRQVNRDDLSARVRHSERGEVVLMGAGLTRMLIWVFAVMCFGGVAACTSQAIRLIRARRRLSESSIVNRQSPGPVRG